MKPPPVSPDNVLEIPGSLAGLVEPIKAIIAEGEVAYRSGVDPEDFCQSERFQKVLETCRAAVLEVVANRKNTPR